MNTVKLLSVLNIDKFEERLKIKIENISNKLIIYASKTEVLSHDSDYFHMCYNNLSLFDGESQLPGINIQNFLNVFKEKILERITFLCEQITTSISEITEVAELLIKLKY